MVNSMTDITDLSMTEPDFYTFVKRLNERLADSGRDHAELAFGLGCSISIIPVILVLIIAIIGGARSVISIGMTLLGEMLLVTVGAAYFSYRARQRAIERVFRDEVEPEIRQYMMTRHLSQQDFINKTLEHLSESTVLVQRLLETGFAVSEGS